MTDNDSNGKIKSAIPTIVGSSKIFDKALIKTSDSLVENLGQPISKALGAIDQIIKNTTVGITSRAYGDMKGVLANFRKPGATPRDWKSPIKSKE